MGGRSGGFQHIKTGVVLVGHTVPRNRDVGRRNVVHMAPILPPEHPGCARWTEAHLNMCFLKTSTRLLLLMPGSASINVRYCAEAVCVLLTLGPNAEARRGLQQGCHALLTHASLL